jgi:hypothetical protein
MFLNCFESFWQYIEADYHLWFFPAAHIELLPAYLISDEI